MAVPEDVLRAVDPEASVPDTVAEGTHQVGEVGSGEVELGGREVGEEA